MSRETQQFLEMVKEAYKRGKEVQPQMNTDEHRSSVVRRMWCEGCGMETVHRLEEHGEWELLQCQVCKVYGHWYRIY